MFDELFESPVTMERHLTSPLSSERVLFLGRLHQDRFAKGTLRHIAEYLLAIISHLKLEDCSGEHFCPEQIYEAADRWTIVRRKPHTVKYARRARQHFIRYATRWLTFLDRFQPPCPPSCPYDYYISEFAAFMRQEQGLAPKTIAYRCNATRKFLRSLYDQGISLDNLRIPDIDLALAQQVTELKYARITVQTYAGSLRAFFRFAEIRGWCTAGVASSIMAPRVFHHESLPCGPSWKQVNELLTTAVGDCPVNIRDYAILSLLSVYGLRAGEVAQITFEDIDWRNEEILIRRSKRLGVHRYPLTCSVGDSIVRYLKEVRPPSDHREVFLTLTAPFRPINSGTVYPIVASRLRPIAGALKHHGPHALRHSCATHLLDEGHSLKEVGDHLGHRNIETTRIYAKVNLAALREVANFDLGGLL